MGIHYPKMKKSWWLVDVLNFHSQTKAVNRPKKCLKDYKNILSTRYILSMQTNNWDNRVCRKVSQCILYSRRRAHGAIAGWFRNAPKERGIYSRNYPVNSRWSVQVGPSRGRVAGRCIQSFKNIFTKLRWVGRRVLLPVRNASDASLVSVLHRNPLWSPYLTATGGKKLRASRN